MNYSPARAAESRPTILALLTIPCTHARTLGHIRCPRVSKHSMNTSRTLTHVLLFIYSISTHVGVSGTHACTHAGAGTHASMLVQARTHARTHARAHPCAHARMHASTDARTHASTHALKRARPPNSPALDGPALDRKQNSSFYFMHASSDTLLLRSYDTRRPVLKVRPPCAGICTNSTCWSKLAKENIVGAFAGL